WNRPSLGNSRSAVRYGPSRRPCKAWITHRLPAACSRLGVDSGGIVWLRPCLLLGLFLGLLLAALRLRLAALEVVAQRRGETQLRRRLFLLFGVLAHVRRLRLRQPYGKDRAGFGGSAAPSVPLQCCRSSVVEHPLGKGEVGSSILTGSTRISA